MSDNDQNLPEAKPTTTSRGKRNANFSTKETHVLLREVKKNITILQGPLKSDVTNQDKIAVWKNVAVSISACGTAKRNFKEIRAKWRTMKGECLRYRDSFTQTGGGGPLKQPWFFDTVLDIIGETSAVLDGISVSGGGEPESLFYPQSEPETKGVEVEFYDMTNADNTYQSTLKSEAQEVPAPLALALTEGIKDLIYPSSAENEENVSFPVTALNDGLEDSYLPRASTPKKMAAQSFARKSLLLEVQPVQDTGLVVSCLLPSQMMPKPLPSNNTKCCMQPSQNVEKRKCETAAAIPVPEPKKARLTAISSLNMTMPTQDAQQDGGTHDGDIENPPTTRKKVHRNFNGRTHRRFKDIAVDRNSYEELVMEEIAKVRKERELIEVEKQLKQEVLKKQIEVLNLQLELLKKQIAQPCQPFPFTYPFIQNVSGTSMHD